jgi:hypothetical protein
MHDVHVTLFNRQLSTRRPQPWLNRIAGKGQTLLVSGEGR